MERLFVTRDTATDDDLYKLLGCDERSSAEQIATEFKLLARKYHPDKVSSEEKKIAAERMFVRLERAKQILLDKDKRSKYDQWCNGGFREVIGFEEWLGMQNKVHTSMHWAAPQRTVPALLPESSTHSSQDKGMSDASGSRRQKESDSSLNPTSLEDFRRGDHGGHAVSKFRNYDL